MSDYISREAIIGKVEKHYCAPCKGQGGDLGGDWCRSCVINSVLEKVRGIPATDVAPVVHGRWQSYESLRYVGADGKGNPKYRNIRIYYCSQCGHCSIIRTKGCPNCRAKMDKEETNELD